MALPFSFWLQPNHIIINIDPNWDFKTITTGVTLDVRFETQDSELADTFVEANQQRTMVKLPKDDSTVAGFAIYSIDLTTDPVAK